MVIIECERCGEPYPANWGKCPTCDSGEHPEVRGFDDEDY